MSVSFIEKQGRSVMFTEEKIASTLHIHLLNFVGRIWTNMQIRIIYANDVNLELILQILDVKLDPERFIRPCLWEVTAAWCQDEEEISGLSFNKTPLSA